MRYTFLWPSTPTRIGGVGVLYEYANGLARRGHEVRFVHGPAWPGRVDSVEEIEWFRFDSHVRHLVVDSLDDPSIPSGDVAMAFWLPEHLGLPCAIIQGHGMIDAEQDRQALRARHPKVLVAGWLADLARSEGVAPEQLRTIVPGIDHDLFFAAQPVDRRPIDVALLYHAHPAKGWTVAMAALEQVRRHRPDLRVVAFGADPPVHRVPSWVEVRVAPSHQVLAEEIYNRSKVFVQASWFEGLGLTAVEAMACGAALVTTDNGGSAEYAIGGKTALLAPPGDSAELARSIALLLSDEEFRSDLVSQGLDHVRRFDWELSTYQLEAYMDEYVADPARFQAPPKPHELPDVTYRIVYGGFERVERSAP